MGKMKIMVLDSETCNLTPSEQVKRGNNLTYNVGWSVITPANGEVLEQKSYLVKEIFEEEPERMSSCYYADKIPQYIAGLATGEYKMASFFTILVDIMKTCKAYNIKAICAHNAAFDIDALNTTVRYLTGLDYIRALPQGIEIWDSMKMANSIFGKRPTYRKFCEDNGFMTKHATPRPRMTAEVLYRFITKDTTFEEEHTALADVVIETEIILACYRSHKKFNRVLYPA